MRTKGMNMKTSMLANAKFLLLTFLFGMPLAASAQDVEIDETNFPDENFRNYLLAQDYGADGILTAEEIGGVTLIDVYNKGITSLKGIEHFVALTYLYCFTNQLTELDVSKNTELTYLDCSANHLTTLDVSGCTALINLFCESNQLTALDISNNTKLRRLECYSNQLTALDMSKNTALTEVYCYNNQIKGTSMDALMAGLPENSTNKSYLLRIYDSVNNDGNVCTKAQVAAAKAKGWAVYYHYYYDDTMGWAEYEGSDAEETAITRPVAETVDASAPVYTLSGQKVNGGSLSGKKGIYIIGGKKVVVK
ncbi:MAG: hypothetical protein J1E77_06810 [Prevotella sp.]|nr:hypothetical protein [Prevotella sp.]